MTAFGDTLHIGGGGSSDQRNGQNNSYVTTSSSCTIKVFHYKDENPAPDADDDSVLEVEVFDISNEDSDNPVTSFSYTKSLASASGYFQFNLLPTTNWFKRVRPGDWVIVYLTNGESRATKIRCFGSVDNIQLSEKIDQGSGARHLVYNVNCRDFGKVFEKYFIYINVFIADAVAQDIELNKILLKDVQSSMFGSPSQIIKTLINTFLGGEIDKAILSDQKQLKQFLLPKELISEIQKNFNRNNNNAGLGVENSEFSDDSSVSDSALDAGSSVADAATAATAAANQAASDTADEVTQSANDATDNFSDSPESDGKGRFLDLLDLSKIQDNLDGQKVILTLDIRDYLWNLMKQHSNDLINEMFCEMTDDGKPAVFLRTAPLTFKEYKDPAGVIDGSLNYFLDLPAVSISGKHILGSQIGLHENDRVNFILMLADYFESNASQINPSMALLQQKFPYVNASSCVRYGSSPYQYKTDFAITVAENAESPDPNLLLSWNYLVKHWFENNAYFEHGSITIVGQDNLRIGKRLEIVDGPLLFGNKDGAKRQFYIESYVDNWSFGGTWVQNVILTRGVFSKDNKEVFSHELYKNGGNFVSASASRRSNNGLF